MKQFSLLTVVSVAAIGSLTHAFAENRIDTQRPDAPELSAYGQLPVGVRTLEMTNPGQIDILKIDPAAPKPAEWPKYDRPLTVEVWYPGRTRRFG